MADATLADVVAALVQLHNDILDLTELVRAAAPEPEALYCPPEGKCPGGVRLRLHAQTYWKNDGNDNDRLFHALPEHQQYAYEGAGPFHGTPVRNHNVWRSEALTIGEVAARGLSAQAADPITGELPPDEGMDVPYPQRVEARRGQQQARSASQPPDRQSRPPAPSERTSAPAQTAPSVEDVRDYASLCRWTHRTYGLQPADMLKSLGVTRAEVTGQSPEDWADWAVNVTQAVEHAGPR